MIVFLNHYITSDMTYSFRRNQYQFQKLLCFVCDIKYNVAYLSHARTVEPQKQPFVINTHTNKGTTEFCNPFLVNGSVNKLPRRRNDFPLQQSLAIT
jgi:hypothetical protein